MTIARIIATTTVVCAAIGMTTHAEAAKRKIPARLLPARRLCVLDAAVRHRHGIRTRSEEHTSELQSLRHLVCRLLLEKKNTEQDRKSTHRNSNQILISYSVV